MTTEAGTTETDSSAATNFTGLEFKHQTMLEKTTQVTDHRIDTRNLSFRKTDRGTNTSTEFYGWMASLHKIAAIGSRTSCETASGIVQKMRPDFDILAS